MNISIIGTQWGDEGKGKVVDLLAESADVIVRFQGGHNAGHTLVINGVTYKLSLLPSGIVRQGKISVIGSGVVLDPEHLIKEIGQLEEKGLKITPQNLYIADNCCLILPLHTEIDRAIEEAKGNKKIGTTGRGIGPAYEDKVARRALRVSDLMNRDYLIERIENLLTYHNALRRGLGIEEIEAGTILQFLENLAPKIIPFAKPVWYELDKLQTAGKKILFEGAQGTLLDVDHGTYPFVTSSNTIAAQGITGSGLGYAKSYKLGITKAYTTRVGSGPFPTELFDNIGDHLQEKGHEFGTVTSRKRRCGWFDAVLVRQACKLNGIDGIALTKLDVLEELDELKICTGYELEGEKFDYLPSCPAKQAKIRPVYETISGWKQPTAGVRDFNKLPVNAQKYVKRLEELTNVKIALISTSPERDDSIVLENSLN